MKRVGRWSRALQTVRTLAFTLNQREAVGGFGTEEDTSALQQQFWLLCREQTLRGQAWPMSQAGDGSGSGQGRDGDAVPWGVF